MLSHRPPISIPRTTVSPAVLEELIGEIGSLASVYHKPAETFIGKGRLGADAMQKKAEEVDESQLSTHKALQTVVAGQQSENLLSVLSTVSLLAYSLTIGHLVCKSFYRDFGDEPSTEGGGLSGLSATTMLSQPAAASLIAGTSSNPLDDLVSIFGNVSMQPMSAAPTPAAGQAAFGFGQPPSAAPGGAFADLMTPTAGSAPTPPQAQQQHKPEEDLLGLF